MASLYDTAQANRPEAQRLMLAALTPCDWPKQVAMVLACYDGAKGCRPFVCLAIDATSRGALKRIRARLAEYNADTINCEALRILDKAINPRSERNRGSFGDFVINNERVIHSTLDSAFGFDGAKELAKDVFLLICQAGYECGVAPYLAGDSLGFSEKELLASMESVFRFSLLNVRNNELESKLEGWNRESEV